MVTGMETIQTVTIRMNILTTLLNGKILIMMVMVIIMTYSHSTQRKLLMMMAMAMVTIIQVPIQMHSLTTQPDGRNRIEMEWLLKMMHSRMT